MCKENPSETKEGDQAEHTRPPIKEGTWGQGRRVSLVWQTK